MATKISGTVSQQGRPGAVLDACVLYPTIMRELLLGVAAKGVFEPCWSDRILEEWALAVKKNHPDQEEIVQGEIAVVRAVWPDAIVKSDDQPREDVFLPDPDDVHVLQTAIAARAPLIITMNLKDFPRPVLADHGIQAQHPDAFLRQHLNYQPDEVIDVARDVLKRAQHLSGQEWPLRKLMKKARLPRLGKRLEAMEQT